MIANTLLATIAILLAGGFLAPRPAQVPHSVPAHPDSSIRPRCFWGNQRVSLTTLRDTDRDTQRSRIKHGT